MTANNIWFDDHLKKYRYTDKFCKTCGRALIDDMNCPIKSHDPNKWPPQQKSKSKNRL